MSVGVSESQTSLVRVWTFEIGDPRLYVISAAGSPQPGRCIRTGRPRASSATDVTSPEGSVTVRIAPYSAYQVACVTSADHGSHPVQPGCETSISSQIGKAAYAESYPIRAWPSGEPPHRPPEQVWTGWQKRAASYTTLLRR